MLSTLVACALVAASPPRPRLAVTSLAAAGEVDAALASAFTESVTAEVAARGYFEPISSGEIATLLGLERQKQLFGCDESGACVTEIAAALGAPFVMSGSLTKLQGLFQLNLQVIDTQKARTVARSTRLAKDFESLRALIPWAVAEACGTPLPPPPSRALPITLLSVGGLSLVGGGVLGILALNADAAVKGELRTDDENPTVVLADAKSYQERFAQVALQKTLALAGLLAGAALVTLGVVLMPADVGARVSLVPSPTGFALVGVWP